MLWVQKYKEEMDLQSEMEINYFFNYLCLNCASKNYADISK